MTGLGQPSSLDVASNISSKRKRPSKGPEPIVLVSFVSSVRQSVGLPFGAAERRLAALLEWGETLVEKPGVRPGFYFLERRNQLS